MGGDNQDLNLTIRAKDEATDTIKKVQKSLGDVAQAQDKAGKSSEGMATSVFKGVLAYDALKQGVHLAIGFLKDSIGESMEASRIMTQVATNVKNAGFEYEKLAGKLEQYGKTAVQLGFDDEVAIQSMSKLLLVTKDYDQARALTNLSMDLARNKNIGLEEATKAITMVTQGNTKALKEYGIELGDSATTADILNEAQKKLKDSAKDFAESAAGQAEVLRQEYGNLKQQIGDELMPAITEFFRVIQENKETIISLAEGFVFLGKAAAFTLKSFVAVGKSLSYQISGAAEFGAKKLSDVAWGLSKLGIVSDETVKKTDRWAESWHNTTEMAAEDLVNLYEEVPKLNKTLDGTSDALSKVKNKADSAGTAIEKLQKIASGKQDIASAIVEQEKHIADITEQIRAKTVEQEKASKDANLDLEQQYQLSQEIFQLQRDKVKEEEALTRVKNSGLKIDNQIAEARRRDSLTDFERKIEDISSSNFGIKSIVPAAPVAPTGNVFNLNFNSTVAGDEGVKKIIKDTINSLNRATSLKTMAGT